MKRKRLVVISDKDWKLIIQEKTDYGHGFIQNLSKELNIRRATLSIGFNHRLMREDTIDKVITHIKLRKSKKRGEKDKVSPNTPHLSINKNQNKNDNSKHRNQQSKIAINKSKDT